MDKVVPERVGPKRLSPRNSELGGLDDAIQQLGSELTRLRPGVAKIRGDYAVRKRAGSGVGSFNENQLQFFSRQYGAAGAGVIAILLAIVEYPEFNDLNIARRRRAAQGDSSAQHDCRDFSHQPIPSFR